VNWKIMKNFKFSSLVLVPLFAVLAACGGGGGDDNGTSTPTTATLKSIAITIGSSTIPVSTYQDATATGTYSDGSTKALTVAGGLAWATKSGVTTVASVASASGRVTGVSVGAETITATQDGIVGSINITITAPWTQVSAGGFQTIARRADGKLYAWGQNNWGQLGDTSNTQRTTPVVVNNGAATTAWRQVAVGDQFAVGIRAGTGSTATTGGTLWSWGLNTNGQLGQGDQTNRSTPTQIGKETTWVSVSAGKNHVLALKADGTLWAWGRNSEGQLGDTTVLARSAPVKVGGTDKTNTATWTAFSAGGTHSLGIQKDGTLWTWGDNTSGQLGNATTSTTPVSTPAKIGTATYNSVSAGANHSMAIATNNTLWGWGANGSGQLGNNAGTGTVSAPRQISTDADWTIVSAGGLHTLAIRNGGTLWAWGANADGQLGDGSGGDDVVSPVQVGSDRTWVSVSAGASHSAALKADNTLWTWGLNADGQLGNGRTVTSPIPVNIPNPTPN
jgi:alpha-tubulin suppressor-like RCC1 family protein